MMITFAVLASCKRTPDGATHASGSGAFPAAPDAAADKQVEVKAPQQSEPRIPTAPPPGDDKVTSVPADVVGKLELREVLRGLARPVLLVVAPGDPRKRWFILEQHTGKVRIVENGKLLPKPFLRLDKLSNGNEQGLLGLAFHPKFAVNRKLYVNYTAADDDTHIVEYTVSAQDPDSVDVTTRREIIEIDQPYSNHNGGHLEFGPDGKLYTGMGDGGSAGDPERNGQNKTALLAKILRFDVDAAKPAPEIVHMGVRNPWRFSFDAKTKGLYIGDVGQNLWEYVFVASTADGIHRNFGWNVVEGNHCFRSKQCDRTGFTPAVAEYAHAEGCSITGGYVYRGKALPELDGRYFYADYCTGLLRSFKWTHDQLSGSSASGTAPGWVREHWDWKGSLDRGGILSQVSSFGVDHDGELYIVELTGSIYQLARKR